MGTVANHGNIMPIVRMVFKDLAGTVLGEVLMSTQVQKALQPRKVAVHVENRPQSVPICRIGRASLSTVVRK